MYERIDKGDGSRQELTREQVAERISKYFSLVDEEIERMNAGHVVDTEFAWYQKEFVPGCAARRRSRSVPTPPTRRKNPTSSTTATGSTKSRRTAWRLT